MKQMTPRTRLKVYLAANDIAKGDFAQRIGIPASTLSDILAGRRPPLPVVAARIAEAIPEIPMADWWANE